MNAVNSAAFAGGAIGLNSAITFGDGGAKIISKIRGEKQVIKEKN